MAGPWLIPIALAVSAAGTAGAGVMQAQSSRRAAATARTVADYNAAQDQAQARQAEIDAQENIRRQRDANKTYLSKQRSAMAAAGVLETGSELDLLATTAGRMEQGIQDQWRGTEIGTQNLYAAAKVGQLEGYAQADYYSSQATASLFSTGAKLADTAFRAQDEGVFG
jgi:hypothetical protein